MSLSTRAYEEIVDFFAAGVKPDDIIAFEPSQALKERVANLIHQEKTNGLTSEENSELDNYMQLEHFLRLAKARARQYLAHEQ